MTRDQAKLLVKVLREKREQHTRSPGVEDERVLDFLEVLGLVRGSAGQDDLRDSTMMLIAERLFYLENPSGDQDFRLQTWDTIHAWCIKAAEAMDRSGLPVDADPKHTVFMGRPLA